MSKVPKVLITIDTGIIGGPGKGIFQFLRAASGRVEYLLCSFKYRRPRSEEFIDGARKRNLSLFLLSQRFRFDPAPLWELLGLIRSSGFNIIETHGYKDHLLALILTRFLPVRWIAVAHGWTTENWKVRLYHALDRIVLKKAGIAIAVSPVLFKTISEIRGPARRTELILNAVDPAETPREGCAASIKQEFDSGALMLGCFGRLSSEKGQRILLEAFAKLVAVRGDCVLLITGDGPDMADLRERCTELGIVGKVRFYGHQKALGDFYEVIDLLVIPSLSEGLPNVLLEAMAFSVPAVATKVGAIPEVITDKLNGWMVAPNDAPGLASLLIEVTESKERLREVGSLARESLFPRFAVETRTERFLDLYREVLDP